MSPSCRKTSPEWDSGGLLEYSAPQPCVCLAHMLIVTDTALPGHIRALVTSPRAPSTIPESISKALKSEALTARFP